MRQTKGVPPPFAEHHLIQGQSRDLLKTWTMFACRGEVSENRKISDRFAFAEIIFL